MPVVEVPISPQVVAACAIADPVNMIPAIEATAAIWALFLKLEMNFANLKLLMPAATPTELHDGNHIHLTSI